MGDHTTRLVILDKGNGYVRHQLMRKKHPMDLCFKLNEQFSYYHPMLKEVVKVIDTLPKTHTKYVSDKRHSYIDGSRAVIV